MATATKEKEKKKYKGGSKRRSKLSRIAGSRGAPTRGEYTKYGDVPPDDVHEGDATYRGNTLTDTDNLANYNLNVWRGHGKSYFIYRGNTRDGELYTNNGGDVPVKVQV